MNKYTKKTTYGELKRGQRFYFGTWPHGFSCVKLSKDLARPAEGQEHHRYGFTAEKEVWIEP